MFQANVYRIMIGCPGDISDEIRIAKEVILRWTNLHSEQNGMVLIPINWETNSYPAQGAHPQKIINKQIVNKSDMLIGIFGARIGSPTDTNKSGTIEEIEEHIKDGKPVMLFFRKINDISRISSEDIAAVEVFKRSIKDQGLFREYNDVDSFEKTFTDALVLFLEDNWLKESLKTGATNQNDIQFSVEEIDVLRKWVASGNNIAFTSSSKDGKYYFFGDLQFQAHSGREEALWNSFIEKIQKEGFIKYVRANRMGAPVYALQMKAYEYFDNE